MPTVAFAGFDCRIPATVDLASFRATFDGWCAAAGTDVDYELVAGTAEDATTHHVTAVAGDGADTRWWRLFQASAAAAGVPLRPPSTFPAASDSRFVRAHLGVPCLGFSPMMNTPVLLHDHDEYLATDVFLEGIRVYERLLPALLDAELAPGE